jgi:sulfofructose kinase
MARAAREAATIVSADIDNIYEGLPELLPLIDILISSTEFPSQLTGIQDERAALLEIRARYGARVVGMTRGLRGAIILCDGQFIEARAYCVPDGCRDTTGAGDAFHGGFIYGLLRGLDVETTMRVANATAALKCRSLGARTSLPTRAELNDFLRRAVEL